MLYIIKTLSYILSWLPTCILKLICRLFGWIIYHARSERRTVALRNLHHCFPNKTEVQRVLILKEHCRRLVEMTLFVIICPALSKKRTMQMIEQPDQATEDLAQQIGNEHGSILLIPHFTLSELINAAPLRFPDFKGKAGVVFRPLNNPKLNAWVSNSRSRFGVEMLSRKAGYGRALQCLSEHKAVGILFDQNAAGKGSMVHFFNRIASSSELPGILAYKKNADCYVLYAERIAFFKARLHLSKIEKGTEPIHVTLAANDWLENYLGSSDDHCADWLWLHDRWGSPQNAKRRFQLKEKRNRLKEEALYRKKGSNGDPVAIWLHLPEAEADFLDLNIMLRAIHKARPDYSLNLIGPHSKNLMKQEFGDIPDRLVEFSGDESELKTIQLIAAEYPDVWINLQLSKKALKISRAVMAHQRFGIESVPNAKKYLTDLAPAPTTSWKPFFTRFGLKEDALESLIS